MCVCACVCVCVRACVCVRVCACVCVHLLLQDAVEDEDKHALQGVEDGEEVGHDHGALVDVHEAEGPGQAQQTQQGDGPDHPGPGGEHQPVVKHSLVRRKHNH